jgi:hypothetical protein
MFTILTRKVNDLTVVYIIKIANIVNEKSCINTILPSMHFQQANHIRDKAAIVTRHHIVLYVVHS